MACSEEMMQRFVFDTSECQGGNKISTRKKDVLIAPGKIDGFNVNIIRVVSDILTATETQQWV